MKKSVPVKTPQKSTHMKSPSKKINAFLDKIGHLENHPTLTHEKTFGQGSADNLTKWAGSWSFILSFLVFLVLWMAANVYGWVNSWDPYPFILLNLVLSCLAALQAPIILMSQNREGQKDRIRSEYDYAVNRRSLHDVEDMKKQLDRIEKKLNT